MYGWVAQALPVFRLIRGGGWIPSELEKKGKEKIRRVDKKGGLYAGWIASSTSTTCCCCGWAISLQDLN